MKAYSHIKANGEVIDLKGHDCTLKQSQEYVRSGLKQGYIENVHLADGLVMLVHEEGLLYGLSLNMAASEMARQRIVGDVVTVKYEPKDYDQDDGISAQQFKNRRD